MEKKKPNKPKSPSCRSEPLPPHQRLLSQRHVLEIPDGGERDGGGVGWVRGGAEARVPRAGRWMTEVVSLSSLAFYCYACCNGGCRCGCRGGKMLLRFVMLATRTATVHKRSSAARTNSQCYSPQNRITSCRPPAGRDFYLTVKDLNGHSCSVAASANQ